MKTKKPCILGVALLLAAAVAAPAAAQDRGLYLGASLGASHFNSACDGAVTTCDDNAVAGRLFVGREFMPYLSGELGFIHFGKAEVSGVSETRAKAIDISGLLVFPVDSGLSIFGRLGIYRAAVEREVAGEFQSKRNSAWTYGIGAQYNVSRGLALRAEFQRYADVGAANTVQQSIDFANLGLVWHF